MIEINFETEGWYEHLIWNLMVPGMVLLTVALSLKYGLKLAEQLHVSGKANEWVLVIGRDGKPKQQKIGLNCFRMPFDQVATFPSKLHKIDFSTQQVDMNFQGVEVSGSLIWTIQRVSEGYDGPYRAYTNLGQDLKNKVPTTANKNLTAQASAIVRAVIANHKLEDLLTDREKIRQAVVDGMKKLAKGWGVYLEAVEITDIKILSGSLFKDLQAEFREDEKAKAEKFTAQINDEIQAKRVEYELKLKTVLDENKLQYNEFYHESQNRISAHKCEDEKKISKIRENIAEENHKHFLNESKYQNETQMKIDAANADYRLKQIDFAMKESALEFQKWNADHMLKCFEQEHDLVK